MIVIENLTVILAPILLNEVIYYLIVKLLLLF